jgi:uncharacterized protein (UPF0276 family)
VSIAEAMDENDIVYGGGLFNINITIKQNLNFTVHGLTFSLG